MLRTDRRRVPRFIAAVSILFGLEPEDVRAAARARAGRARDRARGRAGPARGNPDLPRLFMLEEEYRRAVLGAELAWLRGVIADLQAAADLERGVAQGDLGRIPSTTTRRGTQMTADDRGPRPRQALRQDRAPSTASTSSPSPARSSPCSARTAPARPRSSAPSPRCCGPTPGRCGWPGIDVRREPEQVRRADRPGRPVRGGRAGDDRAREPARWSPGCSATTGATARASAATACSTSSASPRPPTGWCARTRAACAAGSTSAPAWSARRGCCCSTSRRPGLDPRSRIELWDAIRALVAQRHRRAAHHPVPRGGRPARPPDRDHRPRPRRSPTGTPAELKRRPAATSIEVHARRRDDLRPDRRRARRPRRAAQPQIDEATRRVTVARRRPAPTS